MAALSSSAASLESSRQKQDAALATLGLHRFRVPEDGNCLFRAVASQLRLDQTSYHRVLREAAASWMREHVSDLMAAGLLDGISEITEASTDGKWCGQAALVALSNVLHVNMAVIQGGDQGPMDIQHFSPIDKASANEQSGIILAYLYNGHYDAVVHEPNVPNPDYAAWAAQCRYNNAVSERVARKLNDEVDMSFNVQKQDSDHSQATKVSTMQIALQPARSENSSDSSNYVVHQRRFSVDNVKDTAVLKQSRHSVLRPSKSEMMEGSFSTQTDETNLRQRRSSSPGPAPRQSPFTSIRAALEKHRRRSGSREGSISLPVRYEGSSRQFGAPSSRQDSRDSSPQKFYSQDSLRRGSGERKSSLTSNPPPRKSSGVELKSSNKKITRQIEQEVEYEPPRRLPPKQASLNKDYGRQSEPSRARRSSEGNVKRSGVSPYASNKASFALDFGTKSKHEKTAGRDSSRNETAQKSSSSKDSGGTTSKKEPPKVAPKPYKHMLEKEPKKVQQKMKQSHIFQNGLSEEQQNANDPSSKESSQSSNYSPRPEQRKTSRRRIRIEQSRLKNQRETDEQSRSQRLRSSDKPQSASPSTRRRMYPSERKEQDMNSSCSRDQTAGYSVLRIRPSSVDNQQHNSISPERRTRHRHREGEENFPGFHKTRVRSRERRRSVEQGHHKQYAEQATSAVNKYNIDTVNVVTTPTEPDTSLTKQRMPYVGLSPSSSRKVNVQVSTEDDDILPPHQSLQHSDTLIQLRSPKLIRDIPKAAVTSTASSCILGSLTSIPLSPLSPLVVPPSASAPHLSPGPMSPMQADNPPSPGIRRIVHASSCGGGSSRENVEIPLRASQYSESDHKSGQPVRRKSVVEIQPQPLQMTTSGSGGAVKIHFVSRNNQDSRKQNGNKFFP